MLKNLDASRSELIDECRRSKNVVERGMAKKGWGLSINLTGDGWLNARLLANGAPIVGLDHHYLKSRDDAGYIIPPGYHWDVYVPLVPLRRKLPIDDPLPTPLAALELVLAFWSFTVHDDRQVPLL